MFLTAKDFLTSIVIPLVVSIIVNYFTNRHTISASKKATLEINDRERELNRMEKEKEERKLSTGQQKLLDFMKANKEEISFWIYFLHNAVDVSIFPSSDNIIIRLALDVNDIKDMIEKHYITCDEINSHKAIISLCND